MLSNAELKSRYLIHVERYIKDLEIEVKCLNQICLTQVIPAAVAYQKKLARAIMETREVLGSAAVVSSQVELLKKILDLINKIYAAHKEIQSKLNRRPSLHDEPKKRKCWAAR